MRDLGKKQISLGEDFGDVAVKVSGVCVEVHKDGSILAYTNGNVKVCPVDVGEQPGSPGLGRYRDHFTIV